MTDEDDFDIEGFKTDFARGFEQRLGHALRESLEVARNAASDNTPPPQVGDVWRVRWQGAAGAVLVTYIDEKRNLSAPTSSMRDAVAALRVAPVSFDEEPDEHAVLAPAFAHDLGFDVAVWVDDEAEVPARVLEVKLGQFTVPGTERLPRGTRNWGPTDPRTRTRAHLQDLVEELAVATWAPRSSQGVSLPDLLAAADIREVADALGSVPLAMQLRRGQATLTAEQADRLAPVLSKTPDELLAANPALPDDLIAIMDQPSVRSLVDRIAVRHQQDEVTAWRDAAYGVYTLAAREHSRTATTNWEGRVRAYFDAVLHDPQSRVGAAKRPDGPSKDEQL
jgi:hypothetical protein